MPRPTATTPGLEEKEQLAKLHSEIRQRRLAPSQSPAARNHALEQKRARVELVEVKDNMALIGTLARIAEEINFHTCPLSTPELRGALWLVLDNAHDADSLAAYRQREAAYQASKRRPSIGVRAFVAAAKPSAELSMAAKQLKLRRDDLAGGFAGRVQVSALAALGRRFKCDIRIAHAGEQLVLVDNGVVDADVQTLVEMDASTPAVGDETIVSDTQDGAVPPTDAPQGKDELPAFEEASEQGPVANEATRKPRFGTTGSRLVS